VRGGSDGRALQFPAGRTRPHRRDLRYCRVAVPYRWVLASMRAAWSRRTLGVWRQARVFAHPVPMQPSGAGAAGAWPRLEPTATRSEAPRSDAARCRSLRWSARASATTEQP